MRLPDADLLVSLRVKTRRTRTRLEGALVPRARRQDLCGRRPWTRSLVSAPGDETRRGVGLDCTRYTHESG